MERTIILPVHGLDALAADVSRLTDDLGDAPPRKRFIGHLTLARLRPRARIPDVIGAPFSARQLVDEVSLVSSTLRPDGPTYETVATWGAGVR